MVSTSGVPEKCAALAALDEVSAGQGNPEGVIAAINNKLSTPIQREEALRKAGVLDSIACVELAEVALECPHCDPRAANCQVGALMIELSQLTTEDLS